MNSDVNKEVLKHINSTIKEFKKDIDLRIKKLNSLKKFDIEDSLRDEIDDVISKLEGAKNISENDFSYDAGEPTDEFFEKNSRMTHLTNQEDKRDLKIFETKAQLKKHPNNIRLKTKLLNLKEKKGKIQKKQIKVADKVIAEQLLQYQKKQHISFDKIDSFLEKADKDVDLFLDLDRQKHDLVDAKKVANKSSRSNTPQRISDQKEVKRLNSQVKRLQRKSSRRCSRLSHQLIRTANESVIKKLKDGAQLAGQKISSKFYDVINAVDEARSK